MALNKTKLEEYANKVYRGDLRRFKEKQKKDASFTVNLFLTEESKTTKGKRVAPSLSQEREVVDNCKRKCVICGKKYDKDPIDFQIHHVNGDCSKTSNEIKSMGIIIAVVIGVIIVLWLYLREKK